MQRVCQQQAASPVAAYSAFLYHPFFRSWRAGAARGAANSPQERSLTMYRPNFCADCGTRIMRARWRWRTSRRFCAECEQRLRRRGAWSWPLLLAGALLASGFLAGRAGRPPAPPLIVERGELPVLTAPQTNGSAHDTATGIAALSAAGAAAPPSRAQGAERELPTDPQEIVSICGARTRRGTPCSRRVRGTGRCWQHRGLPAILPAERLIIPPE